MLLLFGEGVALGGVPMPESSAANFALAAAAPANLLCGDLLAPCEAERLARGDLDLDLGASEVLLDRFVAGRGDGGGAKVEPWSLAAQPTPNP
mgnify:CR=1 FL=1